VGVQLWHLEPVGWITAGLALVAAGAAVTVFAALRGRREAQNIALGIVVGLGVGLVGWGLVVIVIGLFRVF
jgi:hypothetical protein